MNEAMPNSVEHVLISTQIRCETGPTIVGDLESDAQLMGLLDAHKVYRFGNTFSEYITEWTPRRVLDRLSEEGFSMSGMSGTGQTVIWLMCRERWKAEESEGTTKSKKL